MIDSFEVHASGQNCQNPYFKSASPYNLTLLSFFFCFFVFFVFCFLRVKFCCIKSLNFNTGPILIPFHIGTYPKKKKKEL
jgi:hypothetical protein